eukprot:2454261-Heterocapsa_arctica.AAC.1
MTCARTERCASVGGTPDFIATPYRELSAWIASWDSWKTAKRRAAGLQAARLPVMAFSTGATSSGRGKSSADKGPRETGLPSWLAGCRETPAD